MHYNTPFRLFAHTHAPNSCCVRHLRSSQRLLRFLESCAIFWLLAVCLFVVFARQIRPTIFACQVAALFQINKSHPSFVEVISCLTHLSLVPSELFDKSLGFGGSKGRLSSPGEFRNLGQFNGRDAWLEGFTIDRFPACILARY